MPLSSKKDYQELLKALRLELTQGMQKIERLVNLQRVVTNWRVGRLICQFELKHDKTLGSIDFSGLSTDLGCSVNYLRQTVAFARCYPKLPKYPFSWSQYRALITAPVEMRVELEQRVAKENIGADRLYVLMHERRKAKRLSFDPVSVPASLVLPCVRGRLYLYKTIQSKHIELSEGKKLVDCGFFCAMPS